MKALYRLYKSVVSVHPRDSSLWITIAKRPQFLEMRIL